MRKITATLLLITLLGTSAFAHKGATGIVKIRMDAMSAIGKNMKVISQMLTGKETFDSNLVSAKAKEIADHSAMFPHHFKENTNDKITQAAPTIWENPEDFKKQSDDLASFANQLADAASKEANLPEMQKHFFAMSGTCKSCHEQYRIKK